jgi:hypothetical protein
MEKWLEIDWRKDAEEIEAKRKLKPGQKSLFSFGNEENSTYFYNK